MTAEVRDPVARPPERDRLRCANVGCGMTPTEGWQNFDNSLSLVLARQPLLRFVAERLGFVGGEQRRVVEFFATRTDVTWANATRLPVADGSLDVLYSCHMIEHLDRDGARGFLREVARALKPGGIVRLAVPDLRKFADEYVADGDADAFIAKTFLTRPVPRTLKEKFRYLVVGERLHQWMYDGPSLVRLVEANGFHDARCMPAGTTIIPDPGKLDLRERDWESAYVEAYRA